MNTDIFDDEVVDLFAGPGGWDVAARRLGFDPRGIEFEHNACETRRAAGFPTIEGDVREYSPAHFPNLAGLIGSPPCQTFSMAGKGAGRAALDDVLGLLRGMAVGILPDYSTLFDDRTGLVLDPLRWVLEAMALGRPLRWVVLEQVPTVLPVWQAYAEVLRGIGYRVETAVLHAEQYGVPQTRKRAVLVARYNAPVRLPTPTHSRYHSRDRKRLDPGVLPWVSMAEALRWGDEPVTMRSNYGSGGDPAARGERASDEPAATVTSKVDRNKWQLSSGTQPNAAARPLREPSLTLAFGHDAASWCWSPEGMKPEELVAWKAANVAAVMAGEVSPGVPRVNDQSGTPYDPAWPAGRPSPVLATRDIVQNPGATANRFNGSTKSRNDGVRVTVQEAAMLQTFPADHPWRGVKGKQYQQVGNAVPPLLAEAVLSAVLGIPLAPAPAA